MNFGKEQSIHKFTICAEVDGCFCLKYQAKRAGVVIVLLLEMFFSGFYRKSVFS